MSRRQSLLAMLVVVAHVAIGIVHNVAHAGLGVELTRFQTIFVQAVYLALPVIAGALVWTRWARAAAATLVAALLASLAFSVWYHFVFVSPDHVSHLPAGDEQTLFQITAVAMALIDLAGAVIVVRLLAHRGGGASSATAGA